MSEPNTDSSQDGVPETSQITDESQAQRSFAPLFAKGCGFAFLSIVLALGVAFGGQAKFESWGSAVMGVIFLLLVISTSGLTGWWNK